MIRPTFLAFETAKRALGVAQAGLDVVGNNIANVNTPGYTRQRVEQASISNSFSNKFQIWGARGQFSGQGAEITGISQIRDPYLDTRYRNEAAKYGEHAIKNGGLTDIQGVIDEIAKTGLYQSLGDLIGEISKYAQNADSPEIAVVVRNAAKSFCQVLNKTASDLQAVAEQQFFDLDVSVRNEVNSTLERIAFLNERIRREHMYGGAANELNDERNLLIDTLSNYLPIQVIHTPERISENHVIQRVSIQLTSSGASSENITLVENDVFNLLGVAKNDDGSIDISLIEGRSGFTIHPNINNNITSGGIKGFLDVMNGQGEFAANGQNGFRGIIYYQKTLDAFAQTFAQVMNQTNSITYAEADGKTTVFPYENKNLFVANVPSSVENPRITAANITISNEWYSNAAYFTTTKQDLSLPVPVLDEEGNPTYDDEGNQVFETASNTDNILKFLNALSKDMTFFSAENGNDEEITLFRGTFLESLVSMQSTGGLDKSLNDALLQASDIVISSYADRRDAISSVSVDEEAINMMTYQNYYNAAARYMTVIDEALGTIIQSMGVVGR